MSQPELIVDELSPDEIRDKYLRAIASLENLRKQKTKEIEAARDHGEAFAASAFLGVIDDFQRAIDAMSKPGARKRDILEGIQLVFRKFQNALEHLMIEGFEAEGHKFTYELMEAIAEVPTHDVLPGTVVNVVESGYTRRGKLLRPAKVTVAVAPKEEP